ncbi:class III extradiol ring-cleavage dioxygenase [Ramlibacter solisilvae]|uniref:Aromatic ring-opening dioxygenase LigB n=1 Tax=Ramlibacter tataouinensis TaxID=94132 RepID=A0A127JNY3_9BURK|nr:class III extradiol ring-cleavage dioxygenase [Ramlibacter tataouinensis]AMO21710.1 aromatic ring-opening dioxygenase LigB [Ramlibacter tataouinensis]
MNQLDRLPSIFISHGSPTFAIDAGRAGPQLAALGQRLPRPAAVLVLSPHWITRGVRVTTSTAPETIHDFGGFPEALYRIEYPAPGSPGHATRALELLDADGWQPAADERRGLDHGAWVPLLHLFPHAQVPVIQVSMPHDLDAAGALRLGRTLAPLAGEGVLIVGSGSITHNLREVRWDNSDPGTSYAGEFVAWARHAVDTHDEAALVDYLQSAPHARRAHPTPDHYLPLPFAFGAADKAAPVQVIDGGMTFGVLAMDSYVFGATAP